MKNLVWLAVIAGVLYFGYRWWQENVEGPSVAASPSGVVEEVVGGPIRELQRAPNTLSEMNRAMDGGGSPANAARNAVRDKLGQNR